jgi:hypothetical protein
VVDTVARHVASSGDLSGLASSRQHGLIRPKTGLIASGRIARATLNTKDNWIEVEERNGAESYSGYPPNVEQSLLTWLQRNGVETTVEP